jgi:Uma2 family endonuclease
MMISSLRSHASFSPEDYLELERCSPIKHEYLQGRVVTMAGVSEAHVLITGNVSALLVMHLRGTACIPFATDMKVRLSACDAFYYPDLVVSCDDRDRDSTDDALRYPKLIIEVLSKTTEACDRGEKFLDYQTLETLEEYVLVHPDRELVEVFVREAENLWTPSVYRSGEVLVLSSIGWRGAVSELYVGLERLR